MPVCPHSRFADDVGAFTESKVFLAFKCRKHIDIKISVWILHKTRNRFSHFFLLVFAEVYVSIFLGNRVYMLFIVAFRNSETV